MNGELALDYANLDSENIEILLNYIEKLENIIKEVREKVSTLNTTLVNCGDYELRYGDYDITLKKKKRTFRNIRRRK